MHVYKVIVGVALTRPPKVDEYRKYVIASWSRYDAELAACQIAACTSVMPVSSEVVGETFDSILERVLTNNDEALRRLARV